MNSTADPEALCDFAGHMSDLNNDQETPQTALPGNGARKERRWAIALSIAAVLLIYLASPYVSLWNFMQALRARDSAALAGRVDFPKVRDGIKAQLSARFSTPSSGEQPSKPSKQSRIQAFLMANAPSLVDQLLDAYLTPDGLAMLLAKPEFAITKEAVMAGPPQENAEQTASVTTNYWSKVNYAFFTSPREFLVDYNGTQLKFRFYGLGWRLVRLELPFAPPKPTAQG
ncbi:MAG: hypothetical protein QOH88_1647 [Verrucomicrobiota bacterium]|jgi:hypothetical protein